MNEKLAQITEKFISWEIVVLAFLLPIFFVPVTTEFFEFNKLVLLSGALILGFMAWGLKAWASGRFSIRPNRFDLPVLGIWLSVLVSTIFSDSRLISLIGQHARWHPSLFSATILTLFYFLTSWNGNAETFKRVKLALLSSAALAAVWSWVQYFGGDLFGTSWSGRPTFTPLGSPTALAIFTGSVAGLALQQLWQATKIYWKVGWAVLLLALAATLAFTNVWAGWAAFAITFLAQVITVPNEILKANRNYLLGAVAAIALAVGLILIPPLFGKTTFLNRALPTEIQLNLRTSWSVAATAFRQKPFTGSGPATFLIDFTRYKPLRFNQNEFWTLRFEKPFNEYLRVLGEEGIFGILAWLFLIVTVIRSLNQSKVSVFGHLALALLAAYFLSYASVFSGFLLTLALASFAVEPEAPKEHKRIVALPFLVLGIAVLGIVLASSLYQAYGAEVAHRRALSSTNGQEVYNLQTSAIRAFRWRPEYHLNLARTSFILASQLASKEGDLSTQEQETIKSLVAQAIAEAKTATDLYPLNAGNWESLAQIYRSLIGLAKDAELWSADSYQKAIALDLFNPILRISYGGLFYQLNEFAKAAEQFKAATNLKPDYANAHYNLARAYSELKQTELAIQELELALRLSNPETEGYSEAQKLLDELKGKK